MTILLGFPDSATEARNLASCLNIECEIVEIHQFPDGESRVTLPPSLPRQIIIYRSLHNPNSKLIELLLCCHTAQQQGVTDIILVSPYLCYMRQDKAFHPGEAVSQKIIGDFLAGLCTKVITVDSHLHRIHDLKEAIPVEIAINISASNLLADFLSTKLDNPFLIGPDSESEQWVASIAQTHTYDYAIAAKQRHGDREVTIRLPVLDIEGRDVVITDDMISTGQTIMQTAQQVQLLGARSIQCLVSHALCSEDILLAMQQHGIKHLWSTDSIPHSSNAIRLDELLAKTLTPYLAA